MKKANGSFRISVEVKREMEQQAKRENRSFNNMLEELVKRGLRLQNKKPAQPAAG